MGYREASQTLRSAARDLLARLGPFLDGDDLPDYTVFQAPPGGAEGTDDARRRIAEARKTRRRDGKEPG